MGGPHPKTPPHPRVGLCKSGERMQSIGRQNLNNIMGITRDYFVMSVLCMLCIMGPNLQCKTMRPQTRDCVAPGGGKYIGLGFLRFGDGRLSSLVHFVVVRIGDYTSELDQARANLDLAHSEKTGCRLNTCETNEKLGKNP